MRSQVGVCVTFWVVDGVVGGFRPMTSRYIFWLSKIFRRFLRPVKVHGRGQGSLRFGRNSNKLVLVFRFVNLSLIPRTWLVYKWVDPDPCTKLSPLASNSLTPVKLMVGVVCG